LSPNGYGFFRTPKDINLRIWVSLEELAEICNKVPVDPFKNITKKTTWKHLTDTSEDQAWLKEYFTRPNGRP
jgi:hypothetical protein